MTFCPERAGAAQARRGGPPAPLPMPERRRVDADLRRPGPSTASQPLFGRPGDDSRPARGEGSRARDAWAAKAHRPGPSGCA